MSHVYDINTPMDSKHVLKDFVVVLQEYFNVEWDKAINKPFANSGRGKNTLRSYNMIKFSAETESYVKCIMEKRDLNAMAKFCFGVAPLQIEIGDYNGVVLTSVTYVIKMTLKMNGMF